MCVHVCIHMCVCVCVGQGKEDKGEGREGKRRERMGRKGEEKGWFYVSGKCTSKEAKKSHHLPSANCNPFYLSHINIVLGVKSENLRVAVYISYQLNYVSSQIPMVKS